MTAVERHAGESAPTASCAERFGSVRQQLAAGTKTADLSALERQRRRLWERCWLGEKRGLRLRLCTGMGTDQQIEAASAGLAWTFFFFFL